MRGTKGESIPPLRDSSGKWALTSCEKADLLASCFGKKFIVPEIIVNGYSDLGPSPNHKQSGFLPVRTRIVKRLLKQLCMIARVVRI